MVKKPLSLAQKIINNHLLCETDNSYLIHIDHTLTQDATGTMAYLELMSMNINKIKTDLSVSYVDHNTLQNGFENADDHLFLQSVASKYGILFSKAGNGICHQVHLERFAKPGVTLLGSDSHTPTSGAIGALAIGSGGMDVALAMAGKPYSLNKPKIVNVILHNKLRNGVVAKDIILELLRRCSIKGGVNKIFEYSGDGLQYLSISDRATLCNMGAELGATSSVFPSDKETLKFLDRQGRKEDYVRLSADEGAFYDETIEVDLSKLSCLIACPSQPDNIKKASDLQGLPVNQVLIGGCTNGSFEDMVCVASILKGKKIHPKVSFAINPGSKQVLSMMIKYGLLYDILQSGARILECTCGPCIGIGQAPSSNSISLRTYNRNFYGRCGTNSASVYLTSPIVAALSAIEGKIVDATDSKDNFKKFNDAVDFVVDDSMIIKPSFSDDIFIGENIIPLPHFEPLPKKMSAKVVIKVGDNITTDHIMPAGSKVLPYRSNIKKLSDFCFGNIKSDFKKLCLDYKISIIVGGLNYGQGSSREHASIVPRYLGVRAVLAKSFARIHKKNLINFGIVPIEIDDFLYEKINESDTIDFDFSNLDKNIVILNNTIKVLTAFNEEEIDCLKKGALLNCL